MTAALADDTVVIAVERRSSCTAAEPPDDLNGWLGACSTATNFTLNRGECPTVYL